MNKQSKVLQILEDSEMRIKDYVLDQINQKVKDDLRICKQSCLEESLTSAVYETYGSGYAEQVPEYFSEAVKLEKKGKITEKKTLEDISEKDLGKMTIINTSTKFAKGTYLTAKYLVESVFTIPTRFRKNLNWATEGADAFAGVSFSSIIEYAILIPLFEDKPYLAAIPIATNIASGFYEWYRHEKNKLQTQLIENQ